MNTDSLKARFPDIKLSYGAVLHKKVHCDMYQIVPKGKKCILFSFCDGNDLCIMFYIMFYPILLDTP